MRRPRAGRCSRFQISHVPAEVRAPSVTGFAIATRTRWIDGHPLPDGHPGDARARLDNMTGELVPEHEWTAGMNAPQWPVAK